jgi:hypothetical protein
LEKWRRFLLLLGETRWEWSTMRDALWHRLRCTFMQGLYDDDTSSAFIKSLMDSNLKLEAAAVEKGKKKREAKNREA